MLQNLMENYLNSKTVSIYPVSDKSMLPVEPKNNKWIVENKKLKGAINNK